MPRNRIRIGLWSFLCLCLALSSASAWAQPPRAWLERERMYLNETVNLKIEIEGDVGSSPDYSPLQRDFELLARDSDTRMEQSAGRLVARTRYSIVLHPMRSGALTIPPLQVAGQQTQALQLQVDPGSAAVPRGIGRSIFIDSQADTSNPYVQQSVGWVVRLYSAVPLLSGKLDQPAPQGASLMLNGEDTQYDRLIEGRLYKVIERRFLLVPERSGPMAVPPARFVGRAAPGPMEEMMGHRGEPARVTGLGATLNVRPMPADAPQPWLPLRNLVLRYRITPQRLQVGNAATLEVEATLDGATAVQAPDLRLPPIDGVQVLPEPVQSEEGFPDGRPRVRLSRKFTLLPARPGAVRLEGLSLDWWDVGAGALRTARLAPLEWTVAPGTGAPAAAPVPLAETPDPAAGTAAGPSAGTAIAPASLGGGAWALIAVAFATLWLGTLLWAMHLRGRSARARAASATEADAAGAAAARVHSAGQAAAPGAGRRSRVGKAKAQGLRQLLDAGDFDQIAAGLRALASPPAADDDELVERLADPAQREAVQALRRARWGDGDAVAARARLRAAFAQGPLWRDGVGAGEVSPLPPLYPPAPR